MRFPDSIGLFYSAFTYYLGFKVNSGEYKMMGLAPYADRSDRQTSKFVRSGQTTSTDDPSRWFYIIEYVLFLLPQKNANGS